MHVNVCLVHVMPFYIMLYDLTVPWDNNEYDQKAEISPEFEKQSQKGFVKGNKNIWRIRLG